MNESGNRQGTDPKHRWRLALAGLALSLIAGAGVIAASPQPASAHLFGVSGGTGCFVGNRADSFFHTYYKSNLQSNTSAAVSWVDNNAFNNNVVNMSEHTTLTSFTDVLYVDWQVNASCGVNWDTPGEEIHGWETCLSLNSSSACQQARVLIDTSSMNDSRTTVKKQRTLLCHETGHSLGLKHYFTTTTCMNDGLWSNNNKKYYGGHMKSHLNAMY